VEALELGADDYVTKPFGMDELIARVRTALRHSFFVKGETPVFRSGDLTVDLIGRTVMAAGRAVKLSPTEFNILQYLVTHAGKVLTHQQILRTVWGGDQDVQYLRTYIRQLRRKLEYDPQLPRHILTESGVGYRLQVAPPAG
jgi:two-component system KDP operon response regulator KdpE